ncbi:hypothetical protein CBL_09879 [Carabus blaptoides fortunei]
MSVESVISLNYLYNDNLQNVEGDNSNARENLNCESEENRANATDNNVTNGSASEKETEDNSATKKYEKLSKVMFILRAGVLLLILHSYLSLILAVIYACSGHRWSFLATYGAILLLNLFIVIVSCLWKHSKEKNLMQIVVLRMALVLICAEFPFYYHDCKRFYKLTLQHKLKSDYKQTLQYVDDLRCLLSLATALQAVPQLFIQLVLMCIYGMESCFILPLQIAVMIFASLCIIWTTVTFFYCKYNDELGERHRVSILDLALTLLSVCFYVLDIGSDIFVVGKFFYYHQYLYASLTLSFVLLPSIYITWFRHFRNNAELIVCCYRKSLTLISKVKKIELNEPLDSECSEARINCHIELVENNFNLATFRYNESYTESIMQLILQTAILLDMYPEWIQMQSLFFSTINLNISSVTMFRTKRIYQHRKNEELSEDDPLNWRGIVIQFFGYFFTVVTRILAISFAASTFPLPTTCFLIGNWIVLFVFMRDRHRTSPLLYIIGQSVIYTFTPPINTLTTEMFFHISYLIENVLLTIFLAPPYLSHTVLLNGILLIHNGHFVFPRKLKEEGNLILLIILDLVSLAICSEIQLSSDFYCLCTSCAWLLYYKSYHAELAKNNHTVAVSRYHESFTESTLQLILQIAILLQQFSAGNNFADLTITKILALVSSLASLAIGPVSMFRAKRIQDYIDNEELKENDPLKWTGLFIEFLGYFPVLLEY